MLKQTKNIFSKKFRLLLKSVSRSFYLSLRFLPKKIRTPLSLAYLLARTTDTLADTENISINQRLAALTWARERILTAPSSENKRNTDQNFIQHGELLESFQKFQKNTAEKNLLAQFDNCLCWLSELSQADQNSIQHVLKEIIAGQEWDLTFFTASSEKIQCITDEQQLERYLFSVAGCVGEFWTNICLRHLHHYAKCSQSMLIARGIAFGKGLQLTNILRDIVNDKKLGRCYLPIEFDSDTLPLEKLESYRQRALHDLRQGFFYGQSVNYFRVRMACFLPIFIGIETLALLKNFTYVTEQQAPKISRKKMRKLIIAAMIAAANRSYAERFFEKIWLKTT